MRKQRTGRFLFSLEYLLALNLFYFVFYAIDAAILFNKLLPESLYGVLRMVASGSIGIVIGAALITATIYSEREAKTDDTMRYTFFLMSLVLLLSFFGVFENFTISTETVLKITLCIFLAIIEMYNAKLFVTKYLELQRNENAILEMEVKSHEISENFKCRHCGEKFKSKSALTKHEAKCEMNPRNMQTLKKAV
ncbi:MAG: C2H2-type zinc finger protein [Bacteroidota bacterium]